MTQTDKKRLLPKPNRDQCKDAGMALILIALLIVKFGGHDWLLPWLMALLVAMMVQPLVVKPFAMLWFGLSEFLGTIMSKVILTIIFFVVVTPIALIRRVTGADAMQRKKWRDGDESVFRDSGKTLGPEDLEQMF